VIETKILHEHRSLVFLVLLCVSLVFLFSNTRLSIQTDKTSYMINETITAQLYQNNRLPIPIPSFSHTKIEAEVWLNGVQEEAGWGAYITPVSQIILVPSGEHAVFMPVTYTPHEVGSVEFVFKIYSQGSLVSTVRRTVNVSGSIKSLDTVGLTDLNVSINTNAPIAYAIIAATVLFYGFWIWNRHQKRK